MRVAVSVLVVCAFALIATGSVLGIDFPIRIIGNKEADYEDINGDIWFSAQTEYDAGSWGGWITLLPNRAEVRTLTGDAEQQAIDAGFDPEIFYAVSWQAWENGVWMDVNTGNGNFDVTYLVGEHWSPENRGFNIVIEGNLAAEAYVTPGSNEIDILTFQGISVADEVMSLEFIGNPDTGAGDLNAMFSGLVIDLADGAAVEPTSKLTTSWGEIKK